MRTKWKLEEGPIFEDGKYWHVCSLMSDPGENGEDDAGETVEVVVRQRLEPKEAKRDDFAAQEVMPSNGKRGIFFVGRGEALGRM